MNHSTSSSFPRAPEGAPRSDLDLAHGLAQLLISAPPSVELLTQALDMIACLADATACTLTRPAPIPIPCAKPPPGSPFRFVPYAVFPPRAWDPADPSLCQPHDSADAPWHVRAIDGGQSILLRQDVPEQRMGEAERDLLMWGQFQSASLVPLVAQSQTVGVLAACEVRAWRLAPFTPARIRKLELAAPLLAAALVRIRAAEQLQQQADEVRRLGQASAAILERSETAARTKRRAERFELVASLSNHIARAADVDMLARLAVEQTMDLFESAEVTLLVTHGESGEALCWAGATDAIPRLTVSGQRVRIETDDWVRRVLHAGRAVVAPETVDGQVRVVFASPLEAGGQTIGTFKVTLRRAEPFDPIDVLTLETLAGQFATGLSSTRAQEITRQHTARLQILQRLSREITASLDIDRVCQAVYRGARELMDCDAFFIALYDSQTEMCDHILRVEAGNVLPPERFALGDGLAGYVIRSRRPVIVSDVARETRFAIRQWCGHRESRSLLCAPMLVGDQVLGALSVQSYRTDGYDQTDLSLFSTFVAHAAIAINNARLFTESQRKMAQLSVLNQVGRIVSSTIEIDQLLELVYDQVRRILRADTYYVALLDQATRRLTVEILVDAGERFPRCEIPQDTGLANLVLRRREPLLLRDMSNQIASLNIEPVVLGQPRLSESWLGVPMMTSEHVIGILAVSSYAAASFDESDQEILQNVATQAAIAIDNARHHAEVEEQARRDSLTQVFNHGYFLVRLDQAVASARENRTPLSLIMLDVDHFKEYNDRYGHLAGDAILRGTVRAIRSNIKRTDLVGRWGGEEFAIALLGGDRQGARTVAERIRRTLAAADLQDDQGRPVPVPTVSQGIATLGEDADQAIALVDVADRRLYVAKARGRDQVEG